MKPPKVEFHNLTRHRLDFFVAVVDAVTEEDGLIHPIVVTVRELPAEAQQDEPEKRQS